MKEEEQLGISLFEKIALAVIVAIAIPIVFIFFVQVAIKFPAEVSQQIFQSILQGSALIVFLINTIILYRIYRVLLVYTFKKK